MPHPVSRREFRLVRSTRDRLGLRGATFALDGDTAHVDLPAVRRLALRMEVDPGELLAAGLLPEALHRPPPGRGGEGPQGAVGRAAARLEAELGTRRVRSGLTPFVERYPPAAPHPREATPPAAPAG